MRREDILKLLAFGLSPEDIAKALGIPTEEVLAIKTDYGRSVPSGKDD